MDMEKQLLEMGVKIKRTYLGVKVGEYGWKHHAWKVKIRRNGHSYQGDFKMGMGLTHKPTRADFIGSMIRDAEDVGFFCLEDFAGEFGYPMETKEEKAKAKRIYSACVKESKALDRLFTMDEQYELREILYHQ